MLDFQGRTRELGLLRSLLDRPEPVLLRLEGPSGIGKTALLRRALGDYDAVHHFVPPLPESAQRAGLRTSIGSAEAGAASWDAVFAAFSERPAAGDRPKVLALDDAHRLAESRARVLEPLVRWLRAPARGGPPCHVVLAGRSLDALFEQRTAEQPGEHAVTLGPLTLRAAAPFLPGNSAVERVVAYAVFGGVPGRLRLLDADASLATNVRRLLVDANAPLRDVGIDMLQRELQTPARYAAILAALSAGERDWAAVHAAVPDVSSGGQIAPYLRRLERLGVVEVRRSLDARAGSRNRRYRIVDGFDAFWFGQVLPRLGRIEAGDATEVLAELRAALAGHVTHVFPQICRQHMIHDAVERLPANARECGSLWGPGYDIPVAGLLASGAAFYGVPLWSSGPTPETLERLDTDIRETRYGFGREQRLRVLFSAGPFTAELERRVARRHDTVLVDAETLVGADGAR